MLTLGRYRGWLFRWDRTREWHRRFVFAMKAIGIEADASAFEIRGMEAHTIDKQLVEEPLVYFSVKPLWPLEQIERAFSPYKRHYENSGQHYFSIPFSYFQDMAIPPKPRRKKSPSAEAERPE